MSRKIAKNRHDHRAAEMELDTIYYLTFVPISGTTDEHKGIHDNPWMIKLSSNPENKPELVEFAIKTFESYHKVNSWRDIASSHEVQSVYYP